MIYEGLKEHLEVSQYALPGYDAESMAVMKECLKHHYPVKPLLNSAYNHAQREAIFLGMKAGVAYHLYADPAYEMRQMRTILLGLDEGIDVSNLLNPEIPYHEMYEMIKPLLNIIYKS